MTGEAVGEALGEANGVVKPRRQRYTGPIYLQITHFRPSVLISSTTVTSQTMKSVESHAYKLGNL